MPGKLLYLTDGYSREVKASDLVFTFKHVAPKEFPLGSPTSAAVFQALRHLGQGAITDDVLRRLKRAIPDRAVKRLLDDARYTTGWVHQVVKKLAELPPADSPK